LRGVACGNAEHASSLIHLAASQDQENPFSFYPDAVLALMVKRAV
jgi:hypothetical protein